MGGTGEHIYGSVLFDLIAKLTEDFAVTGKSCAVAGHINHSVGVHIGNCLKDISAATLSRWVEDNNIGSDTLIIESLSRT